MFTVSQRITVPEDLPLKRNEAYATVLGVSIQRNEAYSTVVPVPLQRNEAYEGVMRPANTLNTQNCPDYKTIQ